MWEWYSGDIRESRICPSSAPANAVASALERARSPRGAAQADSEVDNSSLIGMMQTAMSATLDRTDAKPVTRRSVFIFRFASTVVLWTVALLIVFSGYELAFFGLISVVGLIALWEFYRMLDYNGLPNFKITRRQKAATGRSEVDGEPRG
jgi:hypothetical protein